MPLSRPGVSYRPMRVSSRVQPVPAVLRLVQAAVLGRWRATSQDLYREIAGLTQAAAGREILVAGCGEGGPTEWLAARTHASLTGVDPDAESIARAEARARALPRPLSLHYEHAALDDLPHETGVFHAAVGEPALSSAADPARAVAELARVTMPMGVIILLQPTWTSEVGVDARDLVADRLGLRPHMLVEWKQMMREAGIVDIQVQDWTSGTPGSRAGTGAHPAIDARLSWHQKVHIVGRTWRWWGWREARGAVQRETALLHALSRERAIGFQLVTGVKWPHPIGS